jgi:hypothetical protein
MFTVVVSSNDMMSITMSWRQANLFKSDQGDDDNITCACLYFFMKKKINYAGKI